MYYTLIKKKKEYLQISILKKKKKKPPKSLKSKIRYELAISEKESETVKRAKFIKRKLQEYLGAQSIERLAPEFQFRS